MKRTNAVKLRGKPVTLVGPELKPGDKAPDFELIDQTLTTVNLASTSGRTRIFSVVPSLDTPVCDAQTKRFNDEAAKLVDVDIYNISMDLPFAQRRWCSSFGVDRVKMLSDHKTGSFGTAYGTLIEEHRIESRAIFVIAPDDTIAHVEYVEDVSNAPNYDAALEAARNLSS
jgi:thiol peroxidase